MSIIGQNALLNQYQPTFYIKNIVNGQGLIYDSTMKAFVNANISGGSGGGASKLGELDNVSPTVDIPAMISPGQSLVYNSITNLWANGFVDYNTLLNKPIIPTNSSFSFAGLSDTANPSLPNGYVLWNSAGTQLVYSTTIPAANINGLATVATTGNYNNLLNKPAVGTGTVTTLSVVSANGISGTVANPTTTTPAITLSLGAITPTSITSTGAISGTNLTGTNTGDQIISLTGDVSGTGTGSFATTGVFGSGASVPQITVDAKGRITNVINVPFSTVGGGTVTSVSGTGTVSGLTLSGNVTTTGSLTLSGSLTLTGSQVTTALGYTPYDATNPSGYISGITSSDVTSAPGYTPYNVTNPAGYTNGFKPIWGTCP